MWSPEAPAPPVAIAEAQVAGKTGTAELGPKPGEEEEEHPEQIKDAWFTAFAPAEKPQAGGRRAADRSRSGGRRSRRADRGASALGRPLADAEARGPALPRPGLRARESRASEAGSPKLRPAEEEHQRALDRALLRGRVEDRDLFLRFDFAAKRQRVEAFAGIASKVSWSASVIVNESASVCGSSLSFWTSKKTPK